MQAKIKGTGRFLPDNIVTNHDLAQRVDTSDEWIQQRVGIRQRHIASESETCSVMADREVEEDTTSR